MGFSVLVRCHLYIESGPRTPSQYKDSLSRYGIFILMIRRAWDSLIFIMGILILIRRHFILRRPRCYREASQILRLIIISINSLYPFTRKIFQREQKPLFTLYVILPQWYDTSSWNPSSSMKRTYLHVFYIVNSMASDVLAPFVVRASATIILT